MKTAIYSLAVLAASSIEANDKLVCKSDSACYKVIDNVVNNNDGSNRRRRDASNAVTISSNQIKQVLDVDGECKVGLSEEEYNACIEKSIKPRFGLKVRVPVINNYGCWCYGGEFWPGARDLSGYGPAMDEYDEACKAHHQGFDCISLDAKAENESCQPNTTTYSLKVTPEANGDYTLECSDHIEHQWCERRTCMVDLRFLARHWKLEDDEVIPDYASFGHSGFHDNAGDFDTSVCILPKPTPSGNGGKNAVKVCCGDYPYRVWYDRSNMRGLKCCQYEEPSVNEAYGFNIRIGKLYNGLVHTCCDYGVITDGNVC